MPHPKNGLKLTGSTHLPDVGYDDGGIDDELPRDQAIALEEARIYADGYVPPGEQQMPDPELSAMPAEPTKVQKVETKLGHVEARAPWLTIGVGVTLGWMLLRMLRR